MSVLRSISVGVPVVVAAVVMFSVPTDAATLATRIEKDTITVLAEGADPTGKFALVFSRRAGSITGWYDLDRDPKMTVNLCSHGDTNGYALFQNRAEMVVDGEEVVLYPGPAEEFRVLESSDIRTVVLMRGHFTTPSGEFPGEKLRRGILEVTGRESKGPERPEYQTRFTVYPTGRVYIRHMLGVTGQPIVLTSNRMILGTAPVDGVAVLNDHTDAQRAFVEPASFILHHGGHDDFTGSALFVANYRKYPTDWLGQMITLDGRRRGWLRSAFAVQGGRQVVQPGKYVWSFLLQIEPSGISSRGAAQGYALDYLEPARIAFVSGQGALDLGDSEDRQMDGFAEGRGCYVVNAGGRRRVQMRVDAGILSRHSPVFEIRHWQGGGPRFITVDGHRRHVGVHYTADFDKDTLLLQYLGVLSVGVHTVSVGEESGDLR
ncbi:MAG TPA: hypothetical protein VMZ92_16005 [Planctomycetota bacterium]|nr:hypothetical protein [Planctomycetota bacterium]